MRAQRMIFHAFAFTALAAMCVAQSSTGAGSQGMGQPGTGQQGMGRQNGTESSMPSSMSDDSMPRHDSTMKSPDQMFVMKAAQGGMAEVKMGTIAKQNGGSDAVKQFGEKMATDHSQANDELRQLAQQKGINLPSDVSSKDKRMSKMLESKKGSEFDKAYMHDMVKDHEMDVAEFRQEAEKGKDPEVKAWAQKTLPVLEQHLTTAKEVAGKVGVEPNKKSAGAMSSQQ